MSADVRMTLAPYQEFTPVADTGVAITFDLMRRRLVLITPDAAGGQPILPRSARVPHMALGQTIVRRRN